MCVVGDGVVLVVVSLVRTEAASPAVMSLWMGARTSLHSWSLRNGITARRMVYCRWVKEHLILVVVILFELGGYWVVNRV